MKNLFITAALLFIIVYPPHLSKGDTAKESVLHYLMVKNEILKYQINQKLNGFYSLYDSLKIKPLLR